MDRRLIAVGILAVIVAIVMISGCTSGPATNATVTPSPMPVVNKTMTNVTETGIAANNTTFTGVESVPAPVNNTTKTTDVTSTPVKP
jgi:PBP1b-binding outer membrane lipoprotein LpoB